MNPLPIEDRIRILSALIKGNSIRGTSRMTGTATGTILKLLADAGYAGDIYHD